MNISAVELETLIASGESDRVEFKANISKNNADKIKQTICAFANDLPNYQQVGVIVIGLHDNGRCTDTDITDEMLTTLSHWRYDVLPFPDLNVQKCTVSGCTVAVVAIQPHPNPPLSYDGRVYVRVGPTTRSADSQQEYRLIEKRRAGALPFDLTPVYGATLADLDLRAFQTHLLASVRLDVLEQNNRPIVQQLQSLGFITNTDPPVPTVVGMLAIGNDVRRYIPGHYVQFVRLQGTDLAAPIIDQKELSGTLLEILQQLDDLLRINIATALDVGTDSVAQPRPDYPLVALQQLARNAILHRNYETSYAPVRINWFTDRIEISNPGGPYGAVTRENFGAGVTDYRNPNLAVVMKNLGYVERFGVGISRARATLAQNGNPPPEFTPEETHVLVLVRRRP